VPLFLGSYSAMCLTLSACYTAAVSTPAVAGILTVAGLPGSVGVHVVATTCNVGFSEILTPQERCPETVFLNFQGA
jgi:hypothetical protein